MNDNPEVEYRTRQELRRQELTGIRAFHRRLWNCFSACAIGVALACCIGFAKGATAGLICGLPLLVAGTLIVRALKRNANRHGRVQRIADFYELGLARLNGKWHGLGICGDEFQPEQHIYAADLDLFGKGSVFELLCTARSSMGRSTLAQWLLHPADPETISARQAAIAELRDRLDLREDCACLAGSLGNINMSGLRQWLCGPGLQVSVPVQVLAFALPICTTVVLLLLSLFGIPSATYWIVGIPLVAQVCVAACLHRGVRNALDNVGDPSYDLVLLAPLLERFEKEHFESALLRQLQAGMGHSASSSAKSVRRLQRVVWLLGLRRDEWLALAGSPFLWATNLAILIERWRARHRDSFPVWMDSVGQLEALLSLARYAYENPGHVFPTVHGDGAPLFRAKALGHPLLNDSSCVRCDLELKADGTQLLIVTGSNMAGKSTVLRSAGLNSVLAFAGAPVRAAQVEISPFQVACSIRVNDSLLQGKSRFFAEVERLKLIIDLARSGPMLFLLDEVLGGTNSQDRFFGTEAVLRQLLELGAVGLVTSHDLALTELANTLSAGVENVHFQEYYRDGEMQFDYKMRPGVLTRTNGVNIMAALGLLVASTSNPRSCLSESCNHS